MFARFALIGAALTLLAACGSGDGSGGTPPPTRAAESASSPVAAAPTTAAAARACPFVRTPVVRDTMGMRLGRLTVLRSGGRVVGCRFYALQNSPLHDSEHLPGPKQPVVEIVTARYATATAAHNAFVLAARAGANPTQVPLGAGRVGVCFQSDFYPKDRGRDWACATSVGRLRLLVRTVDTTGTFSTGQLTKAVLRRV